MSSPDKYVAAYLAPFADEAHECPLSVTISACYQAGKLHTIKTSRVRCGDFACGDRLMDKRQVAMRAAGDMRAEVVASAIPAFYGTISVEVRYCEAGAGVPVVTVEQTVKA